MFQRLQKGLNLDFLDNKIAEEQEKQKQQQSQQKGASSAKRGGTQRRGSGRTGSPSKRAGSRLRVPETKDGASTSKAPDPDDFVIGDDASDISRAPTPVPLKEGDGEEAPTGEKSSGEHQQASQNGGKGKRQATGGTDDEQLPLEVRQKLAKLESLTARYQGMLVSKPLHRDWHLVFYSQNSTCVDLLRNYRTAHAHVAAIEPFEATLREHTPLTSISDPGALVEFLNQRNLQSDMIMQELKRINGEQQELVKERDQLKVKVDEAEAKAKEAFDEAAGLRKELEKVKESPLDEEEGRVKPMDAGAEQEGSKLASPDQDTFFSYEDEVSRTQAGQAVDDGEEAAIDPKAELEATIARLRAELKEQTNYINELSEESTTRWSDVDALRLDLDAMQNKVRTKESDISILQKELADARAAQKAASAQEQEAAALLAQTEGEVVNLQGKLKQYQTSLSDDNKELEKRASAAEEDLRRFQTEHEQNIKTGKYTQLDEKRKETLQGLVKTLREQVKTTEAAQHESESKVNDLNLQINILESETHASGTLIAQLRQKEKLAETSLESLKKRLAEAEQERDAAHVVAESRKGHEAKVASLQSQLSRAAKDREAAYDIILNCGRCNPPERPSENIVNTPTDFSTPQSRSRHDSEITETSTLPTELSSTPGTPSINDANEPATNSGVKKKPNKKKNNKKKKVADTPGEAASSAPSEEQLLTSLLSPLSDEAERLLEARFKDNPMVPVLVKFVKAMKERNESQDDSREGVLKHHEDMIEQHQQTIRDNQVILRAKEEQIRSLEDSVAKHAISTDVEAESSKQIESLKKEIAALQEDISAKDATVSELRGRLLGEAALSEQIETLREERDALQDDVLEHGGAATSAKHDLKELKERRDKLQREYDELQSESDGYRKQLKDVEAQSENLSTRCGALEAEIAELKSNSVSNSEINGLQEQLSNAEREKESLRVAKEACEKQIEELQAQHSANGAQTDARHKSLTAAFDDLRTKCSDLEKELEAANQLAQSRYKDLTDIREQYNKLQPELKTLREESAELKAMKSELEKSQSSLKRLEAKERDLQSEINLYKSQATEKDAEVSTLKDQAKQTDERSKALEESYETARKDLEKSESARDEAIDSRDKGQAKVKQMEEQLKAATSKAEDLEKQVKKLSDEAAELRGEMELKSAQQASAQSYMDSQRDQARELAVQMKELKAKDESLEEELADAHRLLAERSREGETMRRMLNDVESRAESKVKEMRERMELAIEERDRAEDEVSTIGRRKARENEDLKNKLHAAEREASLAAEAREVAERREREYRSRQEELERRASQAQEQMSEVQTAMAQLRDTLDETERQCHELERDKQELRRNLDERDARLERLQKSSRSMADELRNLQAANRARQGGSATPSRSSVESSRVTSPAPRTSIGTAASSEAGVDYAYLRNVLLQFLEQKDKKFQLQLVPVLGKILKFDENDERRWKAVVSAR